MPIANILTIAGSDSGGGAGIQADLKTFSALGTYGASVITALTAQNTRGVTAIHVPPPEFIRAQLDAVFTDIRIDAVKIGMLANAEVIHTVADALRHWRPPYIVLDTVMIAKSGHALLQQESIEALRETLLPLADLLTPNLPEAAALLARPVARNEEEMVQHGEALLQIGAKRVLIKGGHLDDTHSPDWLIEATQQVRIDVQRVAVKNTHGTGCTLSSAIAALRPQTDSWESAVRAAKHYLTEALKASDQLDVGHGIGPVQHFHAWWGQS